MEGCTFCSIVKGDVPALKVYEDNDFVGFLDIAPLNEGHVLLVPRIHYRWTWDVPNFGEYWEAAKKIAQAQIKGLNANMVEFLTHGMDVHHAHIWIVPIYANENFIDSKTRNNFDEGKMMDISEKIKKAL
ncbi:MAG: Histidine triad (HIT) protein [Candidatus Woesebacteria bacterium GW2011_GWA1_37_8]|uniref:Histidine triad (HIT) protein n=2 Tax=Candidatus Woeseibacteriota TaxID=1752722 RepID=A0A0G0NMQ2_9BACT|nr:MAG: Histidine triad (HIT) protein [Microgenomates group bacterium GW2011_GWC1_37_12b]KKQ43775.1 MAG: Histidine triad (HIT) protein [Candidatus Woesebacteria bacterium GW2011_GWA1_37_8]KKQ87159.1 MAG: Histidine triad (HIT) protein [Candidatus Woesebacteria bacterium GW2011_GWB1_38_8b]